MTYVEITKKHRAISRCATPSTPLRTTTPARRTHVEITTTHRAACRLACRPAQKDEGR